MCAISPSSHGDQHGQIIETVFVRDHGLDRARYLHLKKISKKQYLSGKPVKGEHSNQQLWRHVRRMNEDAAHNVARIIASVCATYPGCILWVKEKWGKVFRCPKCGYEANADHNASVNMHHSFYREWHWQQQKQPPPSPVPSG